MRSGRGQKKPYLFSAVIFGSGKLSEFRLSAAAVASYDVAKLERIWHIQTKKLSYSTFLRSKNPGSFYKMEGLWH
jgi:hypothetical protein